MALVIMSLGMSWNLSKTKQFEIELASYKLKTGSAIADVQKAVNATEKSVEQLPVVNKEVKQIKEQLNSTNAVLDTVVDEIYDQEQL
jgi:uncharacterized coiled-coil DUF342 family protein